MKTIKNYFSIFIICALFILSFTVINEAEAFDEKWYVTCNYDAEGNLSGASCQSLGIDECNCPTTVIEKD